MKLDKSFNKKEIVVFNRVIPIEVIILIIIMLFGIYLRLGFLEIPPFWIDESISSMASLNILEKGVPLLDSGLYYGRALVFHYSQAVSILFFGSNDFAARLPSVFFGLLTILLAYLVGKEYSKEKYAGLVCALLMSVFFLEVFFSRQARFYQLFQLAFFASLFFLYKSRKDSKWLIPALLSFLIAVDTQPAGLVLVPFFVIHILLFNLKKWFYSLVPIITFILEQTSFFSVTASTSLGESYVTQITAKYALLYFSFTTNMRFMLLFFIPGAIWAFFKNKILTTL
ncbi:MAG TPA: glycosyltransferase family 39 protein [archaeon]|nr:glycosyltransferase family 39 protein [archaeon]